MSNDPTREALSDAAWPNPATVAAGLFCREAIEADRAFIETCREHIAAMRAFDASISRLSDVMARYCETAEAHVVALDANTDELRRQRRDADDGESWKST